MELKLKENKFWILESSKDKRIYDNQTEPINTIKRLMKEDIKAKDIKLYVVDIGTKEMQIKNVSWDEIAEELIKLG